MHNNLNATLLQEAAAAYLTCRANFWTDSLDDWLAAARQEFRRNQRYETREQRHLRNLATSEDYAAELSRLTEIDSDDCLEAIDAARQEQWPDVACREIVAYVEHAKAQIEEQIESATMKDSESTIVDKPNRLPFKRARRLA
jgi:hypothetical protein